MVILSNNKLRTENNQSLLISSSVFGVLLVATLASGAIMANTRAHADTSEVDTVNVDITAACTMTRTDSSGGTYATSLMPDQDTTLGPTSIKTICNDSAGYSIYAIGYSGDSYTNTNHTDLISTIDNSYNIHTYAPSSAGSNSYWSMKVEPVASGAYTPTVESAYTDFNVIPGTFTKLVSLGQATDAGDGATGSNINATYKVKVSASQVADTYTGKVKYVLVHPNANVAGTYTIAYNANGGSGAMASETGIYNFEEHTIKANEFTAPTGKVFGGWCTTNTSQSECTDGETYANGGTILPSAVSANATLNLYAMWVNPPTMQNFSSADASAMNEGDTMTIVDARDSQEYTIAKLADGKVWMVENLNLAGGTALDATNTDMNAGANMSTSNGFLEGNKLPESSTSGFSSNTMAYVYNSGNKSSNCASPGCYSYYSWTAATLGSSLNISTDNTNADSSICPKGWKLPSTYNGTDSETNPTDLRGLMMALGGSNIVQTYNSSTNPTGATMYGKLTASPYNFLLAGAYEYGSFYFGDSRGYCWSSTSYSNANNARALSFYSTNVYSASYVSRGGGYSVRCLFSE